MTSNDPLREWLACPTLHLCIDMQRMFADDTEWKTPWMNRVAPVVRRLVAHRPDSTIFTRFIPPKRPENAPGAWRSYFTRWREFTLERLPPEMLDIVPELADFAPPALVIDKPRYSPFKESRLLEVLRERGTETLIISGAETDVCVLAAVVDAIDLGFRVAVARDALCSSSDDTHDALLKLYGDRYAQQIVLAETDDILLAWK